MQFRAIGNSKLFPPVIPNGSLYGYAPGVDTGGEAVHLMDVSEFGLQLNGLFIGWSAIEGISLDGNVMTLHTRRFLSGGFRFITRGMMFRRDQYSDYENIIQGYEVSYTLMNRITYELQKADDSIDMF